MIDRIYGLRDIVEAHRYVDTGRKRGAVIIDIGRDQTGDISMTPGRGATTSLVHDG